MKFLYIRKHADYPFFIGGVFEATEYYEDWLQINGEQYSKFYFVEVDAEGRPLHVTKENIEDLVDCWHEMKETDIPLHTFLGMTFKEYQEYVDTDRLPQKSLYYNVTATDIVSEHLNKAVRMLDAETFGEIGNLKGWSEADLKRIEDLDKEWQDQKLGNFVPEPHPYERHERAESDIRKLLCGMFQMSDDEFITRYRNDVLFNKGFKTLVQLATKGDT